MNEFFYGTPPQDTQDFSQVLRGVGRSVQDIGRGVSYYPYDLVGAPVDLINMALTPVGLGSERPVLGSDYLRNIAQSLGLAQPSTGSGTETAARFASALINPAAGARAVGKVGSDINRFVSMIDETPPRGSVRIRDDVPSASASRDLIRSSADDLASELNSLGFQAKVQHSGSRAGPSSYVEIYDPETGRFFTKPIRFSGHSKGPFEAAGVIDVQDPSTDIPNIVQKALQMREMGPSATLQKQAQKQAIADELIASGMKPKQAYAEAEQRVAGLLEPQAGAKGFNVVQPGDKVSGLTVREDVPNMSSISASLDDYEILSGIREVPRSAFDEEYLGSLSYENLDKRTKDLAEQIKQSKEINPMIVGVDSKGAYIIEGGHRFDALMSQDTKSIPAVVVIDKSDPPSDISSLLD